MQDIEKLKAEFDAKLERARAENAIGSLAPIPPHSAMLTGTGEKAWLSYRVPSLWHALDVMKHFQPLACYKFKGTYTRVEPPAINDKRTKEKGEEVDGPYLGVIDVSQGEGFGPSVDFSFFVKLGDDICRIKCNLERGNYGGSGFGQYGATFQPNERGQGKRLDGADRYRRGEWRENGKLRAYADSSIKWGTGDDKSARFSYHFASDTDDDGLASWETDAIYRLENLARDMHGERAALIVSDRYGKREDVEGKFLVMGDGAEWFHPFSGGEPICLKAAEPSK